MSEQYERAGVGSVRGPAPGRPRAAAAGRRARVPPALWSAGLAVPGQQNSLQISRHPGNNNQSP